MRVEQYGGSAYLVMEYGGWCGEGDIYGLRWRVWG